MKDREWHASKGKVGSRARGKAERRRQLGIGEWKVVGGVPSSVLRLVVPPPTSTTATTRPGCGLPPLLARAAR